MSRLIITHKDCFDGYCAHVVAHAHLGQDATYLSCNPGLSSLETALHPFMDPDYPKDALSQVLCFDLSFDRDMLDLLRYVFPKSEIRILDHHASTQRAFDQLPPEITYDNDRSGAMLAWDFFHPGVPAPALVRYIQARDLWRFDMETDAKPITNVLYAAYRPNGLDDNDNISEWAGLMALDDDSFRENLHIHAYFMDRLKDIMIDEICKSAQRYSVQDVSVALVNCVRPAFVSDVGNRLVRSDAQVSVLWSFDEPSQTYQVSLRSDGTADVAEIATRFGGGGHAAAAGFSTADSRFLSYFRGDVDTKDMEGDKPENNESEPENDNPENNEFEPENDKVAQKCPLPYPWAWAGVGAVIGFCLAYSKGVVAAE